MSEQLLKTPETKQRELELTQVTIRGAIGGFEHFDYALTLNGNYSKDEVTKHLVDGDKYWFYRKTMRITYGKEIPVENWQASFGNILEKTNSASSPLEKRVVSVEHLTHLATGTKQAEATVASVSVGTLTYNVRFSGHIPANELQSNLTNPVWVARNISGATVQEMSGSITEVKSDKEITDAIAYLTGEKTLSGSSGTIILKVTYEKT
ncbi:MAG: hypothetical protein Q7S22_01615 [Candidatus Micrarchaeota archaeon]|nr:hypothetical protein [Candidatus Micrarchaeota archaeon]